MFKSKRDVVAFGQNRQLLEKLVFKNGSEELVLANETGRDLDLSGQREKSLSMGRQGTGNFIKVCTESLIGEQ